jgi:hypothetical protein
MGTLSKSRDILWETTCQGINFVGEAGASIIADLGVPISTTPRRSREVPYLPFCCRNATGKFDVTTIRP